MATNEALRSAAAGEPAQAVPARYPGRSGTWAISMSAPMIRGSRRISRQRPCRRRARGRVQGRLAEVGGDALAAMIERYEAIEDRIGRVTSFAQLLFAANRDDPAIGRFFQGVQERHRDRDQAPVRDARAQQARRRAARRAGRGLRPPAPLRPWLARSAASGRTSSRTRSSGRCTRSTSPAAAPGCACSTRPWPPCASRSTARISPAPRCSTAGGQGPRRPRAGRGRHQRRAREERPAVQPDHQHAGKDRSRTSGASSSGRSRRATSPTRSRTRWWRR